MKSQLKLSIAVGTVLLLSACGQRGPLYLPSEAPTNQPSVTPADAPLESSESSESSESLEGNTQSTQNRQRQG